MAASAGVFRHASMLRRLLPILLLLSSTAFAQSRLHREAAAGIAWLPWGEATFAKAKKENKPLFVSICYVSANACRLQRDAFLDDQIVPMLGAEYVPVIVDRNERPEVAEAYGVALRALGGKGDVPINLLLTHELEPFAGAGFLDKPALRQLLSTNATRWKSDRPAVLAEAKQIVAKARELVPRNAPGTVDATTVEPVVDAIAKTWDSKRGGFGTEPKLLQPMTISFLFGYAQQRQHEPLRNMAIETLRKLATTPVHDQFGGGFHRGTVTADWSLPLFEKMTYDQALMAIAYLEAWKVTKDERLANISRAALEYAMRDLKDDSGAFWAGQDAYNIMAGPRGPMVQNGAFYVPDTEMIGRIFKKQAPLVFRLYGLTEGGNIPRGIDPYLTGKSLLWLAEPELIREHNADLVPVLEKLLQSRQGNPAPFRDDTILAGWNGLMISALARAGAAFDEKKYLDAATVAANVVTTTLWNAKTKKLSRAKGIDALAEDYALLVQGLLDLYEATQEMKWYDLAMTLQGRQDQLFWDDATGRYAVGTSVPASLRSLVTENDVATPGANAVSAMNLLRIATATGTPAFRERALMILQSHAARFRSEGPTSTELARVLLASQTPARQVIIIGDRGGEPTQKLLSTAYSASAPVRTILFVPRKGPARERVTKAFPYVLPLQFDPEGPTVYVCANGQCERPTAEPEALGKLLQ